MENAHEYLPILTKFLNPVIRFFRKFFFKKKVRNEIRNKLLSFFEIFKDYKWKDAATYEIALKSFTTHKPNEFITSNAKIIVAEIIPSLDDDNKKSCFTFFMTVADLLWYTEYKNRDKSIEIYKLLHQNIAIFFPDNIKKQTIEKIKLASYMVDSVDTRYKYFELLVNKHSEDKEAIDELSFCLICRLIKAYEYNKAADLLNKYYPINDNMNGTLDNANNYFQWAKYYYHNYKDSIHFSKEERMKSKEIAFRYFTIAKKGYELAEYRHIHSRFSSVYITAIIKSDEKNSFSDIDSVRDAYDFLSSFKLKRYCVLDQGLKSDAKFTESESEDFPL